MPISDQTEQLNSEMTGLKADIIHLYALDPFDPNFDKAVRQAERRRAELTVFLTQEAQRCANRLAELELLPLDISMNFAGTGAQ